MPISEALSQAESAGLDLVEIAPKAEPPVCRIMDYGKFKYEKSKKAKEAKKEAACDAPQRDQTAPKNRRT